MDTRDISFIGWLINRLIYKHRYDRNDATIVSLQELKTKLAQPHKIDISERDLDKIIQKYYVDFFFQKDGDIGFTEEDRKKLRKTIINIADDIINKDIPRTQEFNQE